MQITVALQIASIRAIIGRNCTFTQYHMHLALLQKITYLTKDPKKTCKNINNRLMKDKEIDMFASHHCRGSNDENHDAITGDT